MPRLPRATISYLGFGSSVGLGLLATFSFQPAPQPTQAQVARRFLSE
nr:hypothetical protein [Tanacetum cinerariifolium]